MGLFDTIFGGGRRDSQFFGFFFGPSNTSSTSSSSSSTSTASTLFFQLLVLHLVWILTCSGNYSVMGGSTECMKRKYYEITVSYFGGLSINRTIKCDMYFQWTVADYCCYDKYDRFERNPFCCYSETYKLVLAVGFICLVLLASSFSIFFCWLYNLPHHLLYVLTCGKFHLNDWMLRNKSGPYVDPTFYSGEPFWARGAEIYPYPLRPMPPKIFYPAPPPKLKYRWDMTNGEIPLFVVASRQFTRNPYSARPQDRSCIGYQGAGVTGGGSQSHPVTHNSNGLSSESRRNSLSSNQNSGGVTTISGGSSTTSSEIASSAHSNHRQQLAQQQRQTGSAQNGATRRGNSALYPYRGGQPLPQKEPPPFQVNIDEVEAAQELFEALKMLDERGDKTVQEWNAMSSGDLDGGGGGGVGNLSSDDYHRRGGGGGGIGGGKNHHHSSSTSNSSNGIFTLSDHVNSSTSNVPLGGVRPNTTGGGGSLDQYGNYVSLTNHTCTLTKPNTDALNQQLSTLGMPIYSMPGVHTAGVVSTVQNYHVVSSNLGNPMETILEDDSLDEEIISNCGDDTGYGNGNNQRDGKSEKFEDDEGDVTNDSSYSQQKSTTDRPKVFEGGVHQPRSPSVARGGIGKRPPLLKRRATSIITGSSATVGSPVKSREMARIGSAMDHVVGPTPTTRANVPFMPTLPGSLSPEGPLDATFMDTAVRRNSVI